MVCQSVRQTDDLSVSQTDRQTDRQIDRQTDVYKLNKRMKSVDSLTDGGTNSLTDCLID